jgi:hypothetical protein
MTRCPIHRVVAECLHHRVSPSLLFPELTTKITSTIGDLTRNGLTKVLPPKTAAGTLPRLTEAAEVAVQLPVSLSYGVLLSTCLADRAKLRAVDGALSACVALVAMLEATASGSAT